MSLRLAEPGTAAGELLGLDPRERERLLRCAPNPSVQLESWIDGCRDVTLGEPERGVALSLVLVELAACIEDGRLHARATSARCHAMSYAGRMREAAEVATEAIELAERCDDERALGEACLVAVQSYNVLGRRDEALTFASRAGDIFVRVGDLLRAGTAEMLAGVVLRMLDRPSEALARFGSASELLAESPGLAAQLNSNRAEALLDLGSFEEARAAFEASLAGFESVDQAFGVAIVEGNLADLASRRGEMREGLELFLRASERFRGVDDEPEAARLEAEAAELLLAIGDHRGAARRLEDAIGPLDAAGMQTEASRARMALGVALGIDGQVDRAIEELERVRATTTAHEQARLTAKAQALIGRVLLRAGRYGEAVVALRAALEGEPAAVERVRTEIDLARALVEAGKPREAAEMISFAEQARDALGLVGLEPEMLGVRAAIAQAELRSDLAASTIRSAMQSIDGLRATLAADRLRASVIGGGAYLFQRAVSIALDTGDCGLAFEAVERSAARSLRERASEFGRRRSEETMQLEGDLAALLSQLERAQEDERGSLFIDTLRRRIEQTESKLARSELAAPPEVRGAGVFHGLDATQRMLDQDATLVCVASTGDRLATLVVRRDTVELLPAELSLRDAKAKLAALQELMDRSLVRLAMGREPSASMRESVDGLLTELGDGILGAVVDQLSGHLGLCLPGELSMLPVAALRVDGRSLVLRCVPMLVPSPVWVQAKPAADREGLLVAGVADDQAPGIDHELDEVTKCRPDAELLRGDDATITGFEKAAGAALVIHLSCHAVYAPVDPMGSRVRLADGWHSARRIAGLDLRGTEVVFGGCETGAVDSVAAGEEFGLVRAALLAGARSVVASRWRLHDKAAAAMLSSLHSMQGSVIERLAVLQADAATNNDHPALWGGLFAVGCVS